MDSDAVHGSTGPAPRARRRAGKLRTITFVAIGLCLIYLILTHTLIAYLADASPDRALRISPRDPVALMNTTERLLSRPTPQPSAATTDTSLYPTTAEAKSRLPAEPTIGIEAELEPEQVIELRARAEQALAADPLSARAIRILGQLAELEKDSTRGAALITEAVRRSKHDSLAVFMMIRRSLDAEDWDAALFYADVLMRARHDLVAAVSPVVVRLLEVPAASEKVRATIAQGPVWRSAFIEGMYRSLTNARTPLDLFMALKEAGKPPSRVELLAYLDFLIRNQFFEVAYYTWLQFLPPELMMSAGFIFNGSFDLPATGMPFDWSLPRPLGSSVEIARVPGEPTNRALRIEFGSGRVQLGNIQQRTLLAPGTYTLSGRFRGEVIGRRGTRVTVSCAASTNQRIAESPMFVGNEPTWQTFDVTFDVPTTCPSQMIRVIHDSRFSAEQMVKGTVWYDDIRIAAVQAPAPEQAIPPQPQSAPGTPQGTPAQVPPPQGAVSGAQSTQRPQRQQKQQ